jgi:hypothetical protein
MFYEDHFNPAHNDNDIDSVVLKERKRLAEEIKRADKNFEVYRRPFMKEWKDGKFYKNITVELYGSGDTGAHIKNAVTNQRTGYIVGSADEDLFFKVIVASGINGRRDPLKLFYDSPEQHENHFFVTIDQKVKEEWHNKNFLARKKYM